MGITFTWLIKFIVHAQYSTQHDKRHIYRLYIVYMIYAPATGPGYIPLFRQLNIPITICIHVHVFLLIANFTYKCTNPNPS